MTRCYLLPALVFTSLLAGCPAESVDPDDDDLAADDDDDAVGPLDSYEVFNGDGESTISYAGQTFRQVLITSLNDRIGGMTTRIDEGWSPDAAAVIAECDRYLRYTDDWAGNDHGVSAVPAPVQATLGDFGSSANLIDKLAGQDADGQHKVWTDLGIVGWTDNPAPLALLDGWVADLGALAEDRVNGAPALDPDGAPVAAVYLDDQGRDLQQLIQKFLLVGIAFSQGADDYLDDDFENKGLLSDHSAPADGVTHTALEHAWDEGFGYFGAARDYVDYSDAQIADGVERDTNGDDAIDIAREMNHGFSVNAGKRDNFTGAGTDFTGDAWTGFLSGRALLAETVGTAAASPGGARFEELQGHRDLALTAWEATIAATVVHYINEVLQDMNAAEYDYTNHAKHWSELKGFSLGLQFNRRSPLGVPEFAAVHSMIRDAPPLPGDMDWDAYPGDLVDARTILGLAYGFDSETLGDAAGVGGW